jgi:putative transposase
MLVRKAYRYRLYPNIAQEHLLAINFGQARFVYNHFLAERKVFYEAHKTEKKKGLTYYDNAARLRDMKREEAFAWLKEAHSQVLQQSLKDLDRAYQNFFAKRAKYPRFHKKRDKQTAHYPQGVKVGEAWVEIPKIGRVKAIIHRPFEGKIKNVTLTKTKSGRYFASIQVEMNLPEPKPPKPESVGVDLGLKSFVVTSDNLSIPTQKYMLKAQKQLARLQRRVSRRQKGSHGRDKARQLVARKHEKVANQRADFLHKTSGWLVKHYGLIGIEDLHVAGMVKNHKLARAISDAGWGELRRQLTYKGKWHGTEVVVIDRFFPSSRRCSLCGHVLTELNLCERVWDCPACRAHHNRDLNAARNIKIEAQTRAGIARSRTSLCEVNAGGEGVSPAVRLAVFSELGSRLL